MALRAASASGVGDDPLAAAQAAIDEVRIGLQGEQADLALVFAGAAYAPALQDIDALIGERLAPRRRLGTTTGGVIAGGSELERRDCIGIWAAHLDGAEVTPLRFPSPEEGATSVEWPEPPVDTQGLVLLADPLTFPYTEFFAWLEHLRPGLPVSGGLASAGPRANRLLLDGEISTGGGVAVALGGGVRLRTLVSQGCRPIGQSYTVTRAERNLLQELGGAMPVQRVRETFTDADPADKALMRAGLHIGLVIDEYQESFDRGDFLVRGVLGAESGTGAIAVGDLVHVGQTVQFHVRDAESADQDLREMLGKAVTDVEQPAGALLFTCNGRGSHLFGEPDHDVTLLREFLGDIPVAGFFCAGEFGPVRSRNFVHGFTASVLVVEA